MDTYEKRLHWEQGLQQISGSTFCSRVTRSDYDGISGLENHKTYPAVSSLPIWISAQLFSGCKGLSLNPVCASHFSLCPVSSHCALLWWECFHLLGNFKGTEGLLLDAHGAVMSSGWTCLGPSTSPQRAGALILTSLVVLCWIPLLRDPKICAQYSKHDTKNAYLKGVISALDLLTVLLIPAAQDCCTTFCAARTCCWLTFSCLSFMASEAFSEDELHRQWLAEGFWSTLQKLWCLHCPYRELTYFSFEGRFLNLTMFILPVFVQEQHWVIWRC